MRRLALVCSLITLVASMTQAADTTAATAQLQRDYPDVQFVAESGRLARVWGTEFGYGQSPEDTAAAFVATSAEVFGVPAHELVPGNQFNGQRTAQLMYDRVTGTHRFTLVYYTQVKDGLPVHNCDLRLLVRNEPGYPLVLAASALRELDDFTVPAGAPAAANETSAHAAALAEQPDLLNFTPAATVVWPGTHQASPAVALVFEADNGLQGEPDFGKWLFIADAFTGRILSRESLIVHTDVIGNVQGKSTTPPKADMCSPEVPMPMPYAKVAIGSTTAYADVDGNYVIPNNGSSQVTVTSYVAGRRFVVADQGGPLDTLTMQVTPPGPANFTHNNTNSSEYVRSEINSYIQANICRDWVLSYNPSYPTIANQTNFQINVNLNSTCNAYYDGGSINFYRAGGGCANTGYASVVHHEYGHHIVNTGGSGQNEYGEGLSDCVSALIANDPILGYGFQNNCNAGIRNANNGCQYLAGSCSSCGSQIHACGQLLSGCVWSIRTNLFNANYPDYLDIISQLTLDSVLLHSGGSITPSIYADFVTLYGGDSGPHYAEITAGFAAHNMVSMPPPANDFCADAIEACPGNTYTGNTAPATRDGTTTCGTSNTASDVWYKYSPATPGTAAFSLCGAGTMYDSVLSLHADCPGTSGNTVNCDNDGCGVSGGGSLITRSVTVGATYFIRISGRAGSGGPYEFTITGPACQGSTFTLTTNVVGQGSITRNPAGPNYPPGTTVTLTAVPADGWRFDHWTDDLNGSTNPTTIVMNGHRTVGAVFFRLGDMTCDDAVTFADIERFVEAINTPGGGGWPYADCPWLNADCNLDGTVDFSDINAFVALLGG